MFDLKIIHIGDGKNFNNSKHLNIWGFISKFEKSIKEFNENTILIFVKKGNIIIGFAKFVKYYGYEPLININTETKENLKWINFEKYPIQIIYKDLIELKQEIKFNINLGQSSYISFKEDKHKINGDYDLYTIINIKYNF